MKEPNKPNTSRVFVIHGRDEEARRALFDFLRAIDLKPIEWSMAVALTGKPAPFVGEILDAAMGYAQAIVVLFTGDDQARLRDEFLSGNDPSARRNARSREIRSPMPGVSLLRSTWMAVMHWHCGE